MEGEFEKWLAGGEIEAPNGLEVHGDLLLVGNSGDNSLKAVQLATGDIRTVARLEPGVIDGVDVDRRGDYLVSQWEGRVYRITPSGEVEKLLDTTGPEVNTADFGYDPGEGLLFIPTFFDDRVVCYRLSGSSRD